MSKQHQLKICLTEDQLLNLIEHCDDEIHYWSGLNSKESVEDWSKTMDMLNYHLDMIYLSDNKEET